MKDYYVYVYLDPNDPGDFEYGDLRFTFKPFYIGKGTKDRCYSGIRDKGRFYKVSKIKSILKTNKFPIITKIYENISNQEAMEIEKSSIKLIGRNDLGLGPLTNMTDGGDGGPGYLHKEAWKKILSKPVIQYDKKMNPLNEFNSIKEAAETLGIFSQNISSALNKKQKTAGGFIWAYKNPEDFLQGHLKTKSKMPSHSEETKDKMKKSAKRGEDHPMSNKTGKDHPRARSIRQETLTGDLIKTWGSFQDIKRALGFSPSNICRCCKGEVKRIGGFNWEYVN